jgi:hypothetical protein
MGLLPVVVDIVVNVLLAFVGVVVALWYENLGSPRLEISPGLTTDDVNPLSCRRTRFLHLNVRNNPRTARFVPRQTSYATHGTITFVTSEHRAIGTMPIRWDGAPEPLRTEIVDNQITYLPDHRLIRISRYIDIPPDESESLAIAVRIEGDTSAFGWTCESYFHGWRHPDYELPPGRYVARVKIVSGDRVFQKEFPFVNPGELGGFDLEVQA